MDGTRSGGRSTGSSLSFHLGLGIEDRNDGDGVVADGNMSSQFGFGASNAFTEQGNQPCDTGRELLVVMSLSVPLLCSLHWQSVSIETGQTRKGQTLSWRKLSLSANGM